MRNLTLKWKFFLVFSYTQLTAYGLFFLLLTLFVISDRHATSQEILIYFLISIGFFIICFNSLINIRAIHRYFPDQLLPSTTKSLINVFGVINIFLLIGLFIFFLAGLQVELETKGRQRNQGAIISFILVSLLLFTIGLFMAILQLQMNKYLNNKNKEKINSLINLIGESE